MLREAATILLPIAAVGPWLPACSGEEAGEAERRNVILISLDTCRADRLSAYGYEEGTTPHLEELAGESALFTDCLAQSTATAPSHMSLLTGQFVHRHGLLLNGEVRVPPVTLASVLRDAGWATAAFTGHGSLQAKFGHGVGFEVFQSWTEESEETGGKPMRNLDQVLPHALRWLDANAREPFFLFVHGYDPHCPYWPPEPWRGRFGGWFDGEVDLSEPCGDDFLPLLADGTIRGEALDYLNDMYDAEVAAADELLGGFLRELEARGLLDDSLVVFTSDHGEVLGEHGVVGHTRTWEPEVRVPLMIRFPAGRWSGRYDAPVQHVDLVPTILSALGVAPPRWVQGLDLLPLLRGEDGHGWPAERLRITQVGNLTTFRFDGRYKVVFGREKLRTQLIEALFDLEADPGELENLRSREEGRRIFARLSSRYERWRQSTRAEDLQVGALYRGVREISAEDLRMLEALGYGGEPEDASDPGEDARR